MKQTRPLFFSRALRSDDLFKVDMFGDDFAIAQLAIPLVSVLIAFLAYTSQYFFLHFESAPIRKDEVWKINIFALCIWICYFRACFVDPGRLPEDQKSSGPSQQERGGDRTPGQQRWCRRCEAYKPPRAHHCKTCKRLVLPMFSTNYLETHDLQVHSKDGPPLPVDL